MPEIKINSEVEISLTQEEIEIVKKAYCIMKDIVNDLWNEDADETEAFSNTNIASNCIYQFMKDDVGGKH